MNISRHSGLSRPGSSRATSVAADILRRRDRPYRTEQATVRVKKRKLDIQTSYKRAPPGYTFVPVGTPDLADRCKELSRQRGFPVNVVNTKPMSKHAIDPQKVSHHIHRIGYHFNSEIVDEAREELGYVYYQGKFVKEDALQAQQAQTRLKSIMSKYGLKVQDNQAQETPDQVRAYIKELFPKIPDEDLAQVVKHAWEEGSNRVGTNETMTLPRRVQLAVIARIRHTHTDYDNLLRAFHWSEARKEVEPVCVLKLKEWREEEGNDDDEKGFEDSIRDVIVIDDDDDEDMGDDDSSRSEDDDISVGDVDYASDPSVEVVEHHLVDDDFAVESTKRSSLNQGLPGLDQQRDGHDSTLRRRLMNYTPESRLEQRYYTQPPHAAHYAYPAQHPPLQYMQVPGSQPVVVSVAPRPGQGIRGDTAPGGYVVHRQQPSQTTQPSLYGQYRGYDNGDQHRRVVAYEQDPYFTVAAPQDRPIPSIEPKDEHSPMPIHARQQDLSRAIQDYHRRPAEVVDLTTPPPPPPPPPQYQYYYPPVHGAPHPAQYFGR